MAIITDVVGIIGIVMTSGVVAYLNIRLLKAGTSRKELRREISAEAVLEKTRVKDAIAPPLLGVSM